MFPMANIKNLSCNCKIMFGRTTRVELENNKVAWKLSEKKSCEGDCNSRIREQADAMRYVHCRHLHRKPSHRELVGIGQENLLHLLATIYKIPWVGKISIWLKKMTCYCRERIGVEISVPFPFQQIVFKHSLKHIPAVLSIEHT